jgi:hypothetical protein
MTGMGNSNMERRLVLALQAVMMAAALEAVGGQTARVTGEVVDAETNRPIACRLYIESDNGTWYFAESSDPAGTAVRYERRAARHPRAVEIHTTLSPHPFLAALPQGRYTFTAERGKEYHPTATTVLIERVDPPTHVRLELRRWIDMAERGWYSGDTHVHRSLAELPNVMLAEDLNVAFPLTYWVSDAHASPRTSPLSVRQDPPARVIAIDPTHVVWPINTEYEITRVKGQPFVLGAFFVLNHEVPFDLGAPPVAPIAQKAHREGALLELDKHNWFWSLSLIPTANVDLFELSNNHVWRTEFAFREFGEKPPAFMRVETDERGFTERGWIEFGMQTYYTLLNCGYRLRPTAGTASGVHPVPLGFGRVYVYLPSGFRYDDWITGLNAGRSFVSTGPMLLVTVDDRPPGHRFDWTAPRSCRVRGAVQSARPIRVIELIKNGERFRLLTPANRRIGSAFESPFDEFVPIESSAWLAIRCWEPTADGRIRFAHSSPVFFDVPGKPLRPRRDEVQFLIDSINDRLKRIEEVWPAAVRREYEQALAAFRELAQTAR